jgi:hypothetical protein
VTRRLKPSMRGWGSAAAAAAAAAAVASREARVKRPAVTMADESSGQMLCGWRCLGRCVQGLGWELTV